MHSIESRTEHIVHNLAIAIVVFMVKTCMMTENNVLKKIEVW